MLTVLQCIALYWIMTTPSWCIWYNHILVVHSNRYICILIRVKFDPHFRQDAQESEGWFKISAPGSAESKLPPHSKISDTTVDTCKEDDTITWAPCHWFFNSVHFVLTKLINVLTCLQLNHAVQFQQEKKNPVSLSNVSACTSVSCMFYKEKSGIGLNNSNQVKF